MREITNMYRPCSSLGILDVCSISSLRLFLFDLAVFLRLMGNLPLPSTIYINSFIHVEKTQAITKYT